MPGAAGVEVGYFAGFAGFKAAPAELNVSRIGRREGRRRLLRATWTGRYFMAEGPIYTGLLIRSMKGAVRGGRPYRHGAMGKFVPAEFKGEEG